MDVIFRIFMKNGLVEVKIPLCAAGGFPSLQTRVTSVNTLPGGGCGFLKCGFHAAGAAAGPAAGPLPQDYSLPQGTAPDKESQGRPRRKKNPLNKF